MFCAVPDLVSSLSLQAINMTTIRVSWTPPLHPNGDIHTYTIYYLEVPDQSNPASILNVNIQRWSSIRVRLRLRALYCTQLS